MIQKLFSQKIAKTIKNKPGSGLNLWQKIYLTAHMDVRYNAWKYNFNFLCLKWYMCLKLH